MVIDGGTGSRSAGSPDSPAPGSQITERIVLDDFERGSGLVELAIATDRERRGPDDPPQPLSVAQLALLTMPDGREIPPSLATWLAYDTLPIFEDGNAAAPRLAWRTFSEMMREQFDAETAATYADFAKVLTGRCLVLPQGADSRRFLYAGEPDAHGEYPVFIVDTDDVPWVGLAYPGFDAYIADGKVNEVISATYMDAWDHEHWVPHLEDHARRNFAGFKALDYQEPEHLDGDEAGIVAMGELFGSAYSDGGEDDDEHGDVDDPADGQNVIEAAVEAGVEDAAEATDMLNAATAVLEEADASSDDDDDDSGDNADDDLDSVTGLPRPHKASAVKTAGDEDVAGDGGDADADADADADGDDEEAEVDDDALDAIDLDSETDDAD